MPPLSPQTVLRGSPRTIQRNSLPIILQDFLLEGLPIYQPEFQLSGLLDDLIIIHREDHQEDHREDHRENHRENRREGQREDQLEGKLFGSRG
jgi:hypothetical protein